MIVWLHLSQLPGIANLRTEKAWFTWGCSDGETVEATVFGVMKCSGNGQCSQLQNIESNLNCTDCRTQVPEW